MCGVQNVVGFEFCREVGGLKCQAGPQAQRRKLCKVSLRCHVSRRGQTHPKSWNMPKGTQHINMKSTVCVEGCGLNVDSHVHSLKSYVSSDYERGPLGNVVK